MIIPKRIQRKRTKGWRMPENTVYVGRPTKWGNSYKVDDSTTQQQAVEKFRQEMTGNDFWVAGIQLELAGKNLACWCPLDQPCHADVLLEIANK